VIVLALLSASQILFGQEKNDEIPRYFSDIESRKLLQINLPLNLKSEKREGQTSEFSSYFSKEDTKTKDPEIEDYELPFRGTGQMFFNLDRKICRYFGFYKLDDDYYSIETEYFSWEKIIKLNDYYYTFEGKSLLKESKTASGYLKFNPITDEHPDFKIISIDHDLNFQEEYQTAQSKEAFEIIEVFSNVNFGDF
jgi:hypothetical protein